MYTYLRFPMFAFPLLLAVRGAWADDAEDRAERFVKKLGGDVYALPNKPIWRVTLDDTDVTDADLKKLAGFKHLHDLWLGYTKITDAGLKNLAGGSSAHPTSTFGG